MKTHAGLLAVALALGATPALAQPVWFTGDVEADFAGAGVHVIPDPAGIDVGVPIQFPVGTISGHDIEDLRLSYDAANDTLYVGFNTYRIGGDVDGDGDPSRTSATLASIGGRDLADFGGTESFTLAIDVDEDGDYDVIAGVSGMTNLAGFTVATFVGSSFAPGFGFGESLDEHVGAVFASPSAGAPHVEFTILRFSELLGRADLDASASFGVNAFMGSFGDAGIGEDHTPGVASTVDICLTPNAPDTCNNFDDDCDGRIDEDVIPTQTTCGTGICAALGVEQCIDGELVDNCSPGEPAPETCNGADDNCNGLVDDGIAPEPTTCGVGACGADGNATCIDGALVDDCSPGAPAARETCDGVDDDCDGRIDEGIAPTVIDCGRGDCAAVGTRSCIDGELVDACTPGEPGAEVCDGRDNDCDGRVDDDIAPVVSYCGIGACGAQGQKTCIGGALVDSCTPGAPGDAETCDGTDEDCDGDIDEGIEPTVISCGLGDCRADGTRTCEDGALVDSCTPGAPMAEICDGSDQDCDGRIDEGIAPVHTMCGVGACRQKGTAACVDGELVDGCAPGAPKAEICNAIDDDCDGAIDEDIADEPVQCGVGACGSKGFDRCVSGVWVEDCSPGTPTAETCNGADDDCDGATDEGIAPRPSTCGIGACAADGEITCIDGALVDSCAPGAPVAETCNGLDDDCDKANDEDIAPLPSSCGDGVCAATGEIACIGGALVDSCTEGTPTAEACNGADDDCDGATDEGIADRPTSCGVGECGAYGIERCTDGALVDDCQPHAPAAETCNGDDDDCDGAIDEDIAAQPSTCGLGACAADGEITCVDGAPVDSCDAGDGSAETCNGADDDCDGITDEGIADQPTTCGVGACGAQGIERCTDGALVDDCAPGDPVAETCNGADDDCDGNTDEGIATQPSACGTGACAANGEIACVDGALVDSCEAGDGSAETCNGADDDCDGRTDEDIADQPTTCGVGACGAEGIERCTDGALVDDCAPGDPVAETCNGADDDCDGTTDEGIATQPSTCGEGACAANGEIACQGGQLVDSCEAGDGDAETCNGADDDCDGDIDEDIVPVPSACGEGTCAANGEIACIDGALVDSCEAVEPSEEICNDLDDDCDGEVDEGRRVYRVTNWTGGAYGNMAWDINGDHIWRWSMDDVWMTVEANGDAVIDGTMSVSVVERGDQDPIGEVWSIHMELAYRGQGPAFGGPKIEDAGYQTPAITDLWEYWDMTSGYMEGPDSHAELVQRPRSGNFPLQVGLSANGKDRDLGTAMWFYYHLVYDDGRSITSRGDIVAGLELVEDGNCPEGEPEVCDDIDNDLDGEVDEGFGVGDDCTVGAGACAAPGVVICGPDGVPTCDGEPGEGGEETCNAFDDDCDGFTDEDIAPVPSECGEGACGATGEVICDDDGQFFDTCQPAAPGDEICNQLDDDCDGEIDEGAEVYAADEYAAGGHAITLGNGVEFHFADDARLTVTDDGARLTGTATAVSGYPAGQQWQMDLTYDYRGQGPAFGGPKIENAPIQPPAVTDLWHYYDLTAGTLTRGDAVITMVQIPADGRYPMQLGLTANGKNAELGVAMWFSWTRTDAGAQTASGAHGDINIDLDPIDGEGCLPDDEICDGIDNDLDGEIDEGYGVGEPCQVGVGACADEGTTVCEAGDAVCDATPGAPSAEVCDGIDNDCDGALDEDIAPVPSACGDGACAADGEIVCVDGEEVDTCLPVEPGDEICDEIDNDCDGAIDEGAVVYAANEYEAGGHAVHFVDFVRRGITHMEFRDDARMTIDRDGVARLTGTAYITTGPNPAGEEWAVDVTFVYLGQGPEFGGPKIEDPRLQPPAVSDLWHYYTLTEGTLTRPGSVVTLSQRPVDGSFPMQLGWAANGKDADYGLASWFNWVRVDADGGGCDGHGDFNLDLDPIGTDGCYPEDEICDGIDNDLDGEVDEGFDVGAPCQTGVGACADEGTVVCLDGDAVCDAEPGAPSAETCDGADNDCDGAIDEGIAPVPSDCGVGACAAHGEITCQGGALVDSCAPGAPSAEQCDGTDNDCDGATDEGIAAVPSDCGAGACAAHGEIVCDGGELVDTCAPGDPVAELCDGADNDCDGNTDEGIAPVRSDCGAGACAAHGEVACVGGELVDSCEPGAPGAEVCDAFDNDCDGAIDEDIDAIPSDCGEGACAAHGEVVCVDGEEIDTCLPAEPAAEICDELDNDCDGEVDEGAIVYAADEYAANGHAIDFHGGFGGRGHTRLHLRDDARLTINTDGTATLTGTAFVFDGPLPAGQEWHLDVNFAYRGQGDAFGGPKIERPAIQPPAVTDLWHYFDLTDGTLTRPGTVVTFTQRPANGRYPMQMGDTANGKDADFGLASWFFWQRVDDDGSRCDGEGDFNLDLDPLAPDGCFAEDEICDGIDNDLDGQIDEGFGVGEPCWVGEGECMADGTTVCLDGDAVCDVAPGAPSDEVCDGADNDCDGVSDEGIDPVPSACGVGACGAEGLVVCEDGALVDSCLPAGPADEICDDLDNDCDGEVDEGTVSREWWVTEFQGGHALWLAGFNRDGHTVEMRFRDDATFLWHADGTARILGTAYVSNLGGGPGVLGQEWHTEFYLRYRGEGPEFGGPKIEMPAVQTPEITDTWNYWDIIGARIIRGDELVHFTQRPVDGSFPFQFGETANGKDLTLGAAVWFDWHRVDAQGRERRGHGDLNVTMHDEAGVCAEVPIDQICVQHCEAEGDRHMEGCLRLGYPREQCEALLEPWLEQCIMYQCC